MQTISHWKKKIKGDGYVGNRKGDFIQRLYEERTDFIVIGLTGWIGSGCTTVSELLEKPINKWELPSPEENTFKNNEDRKYNIIYKFAWENFKEFNLIRIKDVITLFLLTKSIVEFENYMNSIHEGGYDINVETKYWINNTQIELKENNINIDNIIINSDGLNEDTLFEFYFTILPMYTDNFDKAFNNKYMYKYISRDMANNIRASGDPFKKDYEEGNIFKISEIINNMIKVLRHNKVKRKEKALVVIDSFRNPYDVTFFKDRYSAFYLFSVNSNKLDRKNRLNKIGLDDTEIDELNEKKQTEEETVDCYAFCRHNIDKCIELSDVYLYNPYEENKISDILKKDIIRYVSLIMHPGLITPTHIERCMQMAYNAKVNSGCISRQVGAVVTDENFAIKSIGWNEVPEGQVPCNLRNIESFKTRKDEDAFSKHELDDKDFKEIINFYNNHIECIKKDYKTAKQESEETELDKTAEQESQKTILDGRTIPYCFKDIHNGIESKYNQVHTRSLHAEENAFLQISKHGGMGVKNGNLFTTASPCELCAKKSYQLGIKNIYYIDLYPGISEDHILKNGKNGPNLKLFQGAIGRAYTQMYTPILPLKDELYILVDMEFKKKINKDKVLDNLVKNILDRLESDVIDGNIKEKELIRDIIESIQEQLENAKYKNWLIRSCISELENTKSTMIQYSNLCENIDEFIDYVNKNYK